MGRSRLFVWLLGCLSVHWWWWRSVVWLLYMSIALYYCISIAWDRISCCTQCTQTHIIATETDVTINLILKRYEYSLEQWHIANRRCTDWYTYNVLNAIIAIANKMVKISARSFHVSIIKTCMFIDCVNSNNNATSPFNQLPASYQWEKNRTPNKNEKREKTGW